MPVGRRSAPKSHRVEFFHHPLDTILAPKRLAFDYKRRHAENLIAVGLSEACLEVRARIAVDVADEFIGVEADFAHDSRDRGAILDVELMLPESLEDSFGIWLEPVVLLGEKTAIECQPRAENLLRRVDRERALLRDPARIEIEIADLAAIGFRIVQRSVNLADIDTVGDETNAHAMGPFQLTRRRHGE